MADRARYRREGGQFEVPVDSAQVIEKGDLLFQNTDDARAADQFTYVSGNLAGTQANFAAKFLGVAENGSDSGETQKILCRSSGVFEFDCAAATFEIGDFVGVDDNGGGTALVNQQVIAVGENGYGAIGRVVRQYTSNTTRVLVELCPPKMGDPQFITLYNGLTTTSGDLVTDWAPTFPFKLVRLHATTTVASTGAAVISVEKGSTALDDTMTIAGGSALGTVDVAVMDDATGDDIFLVGDTLTLATDGGSSAGEALLSIEIRPFLMEV